jgi:hypothetical protein
MPTILSGVHMLAHVGAYSTSVPIALMPPPPCEPVHMRCAPMRRTRLLFCLLGLVLTFCLLGLVLTATIILVTAPGAVTWALSQ